MCPGPVTDGRFGSVGARDELREMLQRDAELHRRTSDLQGERNAAEAELLHPEMF
jgi:hypothetical protein